MKITYKELVQNLYPNAVFLQSNGWMEIFDTDLFSTYSQIRLKSRFDPDGIVHFNHIENDAWKLAWKNISSDNIILSPLSKEEIEEIKNHNVWND